MKRALKERLPKIDTMLIVVSILLAVLIAIMILPAFQLSQLQRQTLELDHKIYDAQKQHNKIVEVIVNENEERYNKTVKLVNKDIGIDQKTLTTIEDRNQNGSN